MLKQTENETETTPAAQVRVTPQELASALARLESRREAGRQHQEGTVALGEAVQELGLPVTPEELWREVQVGRTQALALPRRRPMVRAMRFGGATAAILFVAFGLHVLRNVTFTPPAPSQAAIVAPDTPPAVLNQTPFHLQMDPVHLQVGTTSGKLVLLSEVGDNQAFHSRLDRTGDWEDYFPDNSMTAWTLIKHGGQVYLRGWVRRVSVKLLQTNGCDVVNRRDEQHVVPVTLSLEGFQFAPSGNVGTAADFEAENVHLDKHTWEKW